MSWRRNRTERPPRVGAAVLAKALAGVFTVFIATTAGVAGAGYLQIQPPAVPKGLPPAPPPIDDIPEEKLPDVEPGGPRTLLVLGSDRRAKTSTDARLYGQAEQPHSDTIVLIRLDPKRNRIAVMSLPRDLAVTIPGHSDNTKINQAYDEGGAALTLDTVRLLFSSATGHDMTINSVIDVNFNGFQRAVNYIGGVYADVDRHYDNPEGTGFASIDIQPGYQKLVGSDALAYVRYRHTDSDIFRNARQQEFLRQAALQPAVDKLKSIGKAENFLGTMRSYFRFDKKFLSRRNLAGMIKTAVYLAIHHAPVNQISVAQGITEAQDPKVDTRLYLSNESLQKAYDQFMTGKGTSNPKPAKKAKKTKKSSKTSVKASTVTGLENARRLGEDLAVIATPKLKNLPFYFPEYRTLGSSYANETPRVYSLRDEQGKLQRAYRIVISTGAPGEYYGVQGMTWRDPPGFESPDRTRVEKGRKLLVFYDGTKIRQIAWRTPRALYYVTNTLDRKISNTKLLAIASSLVRLNR
jgi:polyisoprenyl-teichoic acid--peptidoglycan teichoic acid transferase